MRLPFGPWTPDRPSQAGGDGALATARNCIPERVGYRALPTPLALSSAALGGYGTGYGTGFAADGSIVVVVGAGKRLYRYETDGTLTDISKGGADYLLTPGLHRWRFVYFNSYIIATNGIDPVQRLDLTSTGTFVDLAGSPPRAFFVAVVANYVLLANTSDPTDGSRPGRVWWCAPDNQESWTPDIATGAGLRDMADVGAVRELTGGALGHVLCQGGLIRAYPTYATTAFEFDVVERAVSPLDNFVGARLGAATYFIGQSGIVAFDGQSSSPIGRGVVDEWLKSSLDLSGSSKIAAGIDKENQLVIWALPTAGWDVRPNRLLILNAATGGFAYASVEAESIGEARTVGLTLDNDTAFPNLDTFAGSLDDPRLWQTSAVASIVSDGTLYGFTGLPMTATFETFDVQLADGSRSCINKAAVLHDGGTPMIQVGARESPQGALAWSDSMAPQRDGYFRPRTFGRWHRIRATLSDQWQRVAAVDVYGAPVGER